MGSLLIQEVPLMVLPTLATKIGLNEAMFLQQLHYWIDRSKHEMDGHRWIYNTIEEWCSQFPFWSRRTIIRIISGLERQRLILTANYNRKGFDRTKWYTVNYELLAKLEAEPVPPPESLEPGEGENREGEPVPEGESLVGVPEPTKEATPSTAENGESDATPIDGTSIVPIWHHEENQGLAVPNAGGTSIVPTCHYEEPRGLTGNLLPAPDMVGTMMVPTCHSPLCQIDQMEDANLAPPIPENNYREYPEKTTTTATHGNEPPREEAAQSKAALLLHTASTYGLQASTLKKYLQRYGEELVLKEFALLKKHIEQNKPIQNPAGWLRCALEEQYADAGADLEKVRQERREAREAENQASFASQPSLFDAFGEAVTDDRSNPVMGETPPPPQDPEEPDVLSTEWQSEDYATDEMLAEEEVLPEDTPAEPELSHEETSSNSEHSTESETEVLSAPEVETAAEAGPSADGEAPPAFEEMPVEEEVLPELEEGSRQAESESLVSESSPEMPTEETAPAPQPTTSTDTASQTAKPFELTAEGGAGKSFQEILEEDATQIRGNSWGKNVFRANVLAIRTLQHIETERRTATEEERQILKQYAGFGGIPDAFDLKKPEWSSEAALLKQILSNKEYTAARGSALNAHYTPNGIIQNMYQGLSAMGFSGGTIMEPSMGVGRFFAELPEGMRESSHLYGVELDSLTGRIAKALYPKAEVNIQGYETTRYPNDSFDLIVGNVPFGHYKPYDPAYAQEGFSIHDYFFAKGIDQLRPGGVMASVTSHWTMDKKDSTARKYLAQRADLVGAVRLPNTALNEAGTEVTSDILFFRKRETPRTAEEELPSWVEATAYPEERDLPVNPYFLEHPENVLGTLAVESRAYGHELVCHPAPERPFLEELASVMGNLPQVYAPAAEEIPLPKQLMADSADVPLLSFFIEDGSL
ncbi:MAG: hypothetical protein IJT01_12615 [Selenomonadaceae bacterium]|nr:hypothetical protein [Selenomonadaceae bacterium]